MESIPTPDHRPHAPTLETISLGDKDALIPFQAVLALTYFHAHHPELSIDETHPDTVDRSVRNDAMMLWLEGGGESLSARFRTYADSHPDEMVSIGDKEKIERIFEALGVDPDTTVH